MSFDNYYPNRKDKRKPYYGSKVFDHTCRNHKSCGYCRLNRKHNTRKKKYSANEQLKNYYISNNSYFGGYCNEEDEFWYNYYDGGMYED